MNEKFRGFGREYLGRGKTIPAGADFTEVSL